MYNTGRDIGVLTAVLLLAVAVGFATGTAAAQTDISGCTNINSAGSFEVTQDIDKSLSGSCFTVTGDDIVIEGNGKTINATSSSPSSGIRIANAASQVSNVTIRNLKITNFETGIDVEDAEGVELVNVGVRSANTSVSVDNSTDVTVERATVEDTDIGVDIIDSGNVTVKDSDVVSSVLVEIPDPTQPPDPIGSLGPTLSVDTTSNGDDNEFGIVIENTEDILVKDNFVSGFNTSGIDMVTQSSNGGGPVLMSNASPNKIVGNEVTDNGKGISVFVGSSVNGGLSVTAASSNEVVNNDVADNNVGISVVELDSLQPINNGAPSDRIAENNLVDNRNGILLDGLTGSEISNNTVTNSTEDGIVLSESEDNDLKDNFVNESGRYGIWLAGGSSSNNLTDNVAENNTKAGIYVGGRVGPTPANDNTLVNNTARGGEHGIWIRNSQGNEVSESLVENNTEGIAVEQGGLRITESEGVGTESVADSGNTFTDDVSRNNDWDFVVETQGGGNSLYSTIRSASSFPVTNLSIGASTAPDTTLSFNALDVRVRSLETPEPNPDDLKNISRYFEAEPTSLDGFLNVSLRYEDSDVSGVNESTLELQRFAGTQWVPVLGTSVDTASNTVSANVTDFSDFGAFGESGGTTNPFFDASGNPVGRRTVINRVVEWNMNRTIDGTPFTRREIINFVVQWNMAT